MRIYLLLFLHCVFTISFINAQSQYKITFGYDGAGNQILRDRVCVNCQSASKTAVDSTKVEIMEEEMAILKEEPIDSDLFKIVAYPNPVTDLLTVEWVNDAKSVSQITIFSGNNSNILSKIIKPNQSSLELSFSGYPPGMYIALVVYSDGSNQSFQILKN